jgi:hypothetical protein
MPESVRAAASSSSVEVTSLPFRNTFALCSGTFRGIVTRTSPSPPVTMSRGLEKHS